MLEITGRIYDLVLFDTNKYSLSTAYSGPFKMKTIHYHWVFSLTNEKCNQLLNKSQISGS